MDHPEWKPGKGRRLMAAAFAVLAIVVMFLKPAISTRLNMCAGLLLAWDFAFTPSPPLRTPLREVYNMARNGWRTPLSSKFVTLASIVLFIAAEYFLFQGR